MSHEISRMFGNAEDARAAAAELREEGFDDVHVVEPPTNDVPLSAIAAQVALGRVVLSDARYYAPVIAKGGSLVTVHAGYGKGMLATNILESHNPVESGLPAAEPDVVWDEGAPLSSALMIGTIIDDPTPMSKIMGLPALSSSSCYASSSIGLPLLSDGGSMPEGRWGLPFLSNNPAPLSSMLGLPTLKR